MSEKPKRKRAPKPKQYAGYRYYPVCIALFIIITVIGYMVLAILPTLLSMN